MTEPVVSPLTEAKVESLQELFSRDPLEYSRQDRDKIVAALRAQRETFALNEQAGKPARAAKKKQELVTGPASLEDLGL